MRPLALLPLKRDVFCPVLWCSSLPVLLFGYSSQRLCIYTVYIPYKAPLWIVYSSANVIWHATNRWLVCMLSTPNMRDDAFI